MRAAGTSRAGESAIKNLPQSGVFTAEWVGAITRAPSRILRAQYLTGVLGAWQCRILRHSNFAIAAMTREAASSNKVVKTQKSDDIDDRWRHGNIGRLLSNALRHFEARVIELLAQAGHTESTAMHINATRHLDIEGTRLTDMAQRAAVTKQSMSELVAQLETLGIVARKLDPLDGRARIVYFTPQGLVWLKDFRDAVRQAEKEMARNIGADSLRSVKAALRWYGPPEK